MSANTTAGVVMADTDGYAAAKGAARRSPVIGIRAEATMPKARIRTTSGAVVSASTPAAAPPTP